MCIYILYITYYALTSLLLTCFGNANIFFAHANKAFLNLYLNLNPPPPTLVRSNVYNYNDHNLNGQCLPQLTTPNQRMLTETHKSDRNMNLKCLPP